MKKILCGLFLFMILFNGAGYADDMFATTEDGKRVILKNDGTWKFLDVLRPSTGTLRGSYQKAFGATSSFNAKGDKFVLWYDPLKWRQQKSAEADKPTFVHKDNDIYALVMAERIAMTLDALKDMAITNAKSAAPDARVTFEENRIVNGKKVLCMRMEGTIQGIQFIYYGYYYASKAGVVQLVAYTSLNLFPEYEAEMTEFLNGLVIND